MLTATSNKGGVMRKGLDRIGHEISALSATRMCLEKRQFESRNAARDFAARGQKQYGNPPMTPYRCAVCGKFHNSRLNNTDGNAARRKARR